MTQVTVRCKQCGNQDCPKVDPDPYFRRCPAENFTAVLSDIREVQEERAEAYREALAEYKAADRALAAATLDTDMRRWTSDERDEYNSAMYRVEEAHAALEKAAAAL